MFFGGNKIKERKLMLCSSTLMLLLDVHNIWSLSYSCLHEVSKEVFYFLLYLQFSFHQKQLASKTVPCPFNVLILFWFSDLFEWNWISNR